MRGEKRRGTMVSLAVVAVVGLGGCGFDPSAIPVPGATVSGPTYRVRIQFANALNLPARAKVVADGVEVGSLAGVTLVDPDGTRPGYVVADVDIAASVRLPAATTAQLRQDTVLGDIYIALAAPATGAPIGDNATIPIAQTRPAIQVEDTMAGIATFVRGGAITRIQDILNQVNAALPADPGETARLARASIGDLTDVATHLDRVDQFVAAAQADIDVIRTNATAVRDLFSPEGARRVTEATTSLAHLLGVFSAIGGFAHAIAWLALLAQSGDAAAQAFLPLLFTNRPLDLNAPSNLNRLVSLLRDRILPFAEQGPKVNITDVGAAATDSMSRDERVASVIAALRMVGVVR
ncbi:MlaD family protein [Nocardia arthritidis]|uniref:MCE family protein n=1 Tax=Nocardia arthritidis TaxID=228602 RepID=A0A6G9YPG0_9NOCA|nr:MlaD family protein [Nocardia arthritidis]QIS14906.1 MCE family protein [Nocardia arthritidis]